MKMGDVFRIAGDSGLYRVEECDSLCDDCAAYGNKELCKRFPNCFLIEGGSAQFKRLGKSETRRAIKAKTEILTY